MTLDLFFAEKLPLILLAMCILKPAFVLAGKDLPRNSLASSTLESTVQDGIVATGHAIDLCLYFSLDAGMVHL